MILYNIFIQVYCSSIATVYIFFLYLSEGMNLKSFEVPKTYSQPLTSPTLLGFCK